MAIFAAAPFLGPVIGPIVGGFVGETVGWRWVEGVMAIFTGVLWIAGSAFIPETYPPVLLRQRASKLSKMTGKVYRSQADVDQGPTTFGHVFATSLLRPWVLLFKEPIVLLLSIYMAIVYGTLYMLFVSFGKNSCRLSETCYARLGGRDNPTTPHLLLSVLANFLKGRFSYRVPTSPRLESWHRRARFPGRCGRHDLRGRLQRLGQQALF